VSDVVLVNMPYSAIEHPSIALGYFAASLRARAIDVDALSANLFFAKVIGLKEYFLFSNFYNIDLLGEWTFSGAAFPEFETDSDAYLAKLRLPLSESALRRVRACAPDFIDEMAARVLDRSPRIVGCTSTFQQNCASLALLRRIRERAPDVVTVMGGANCESMMGRALSRCFDWVDYVFSGEADDTFPQFCDHVLRSPNRVAAVDAIAAWAPPHVFRAGHAVTPASPPAVRTTNLLSQPKAVEPRTPLDLNTVPCPDYDDYFRDLQECGLARHILPGLMIESSRGCWWGAKQLCTFCGLNGESIGFRAKRPEVFHEELRQLTARYGIPSFEVVDNILDMSYFKTLLPAIIESGEQYGFLYEIKSNLRRSQVEMLAAAGIRWVQPGIESLEDDVLRLMRKGATTCQNVQLLKWCRELGIFVIWNYLSDFPGEQDAWHTELLELLPLLTHYQPPSAPGSPLRYDRFSVYHNEPEEFGLELRPSWTYSTIYPLPDADIADLAYFFDNLRPEVAGLPEQRPNWWKAREQLVEWRNLHYHKDDDDVWAELHLGTPMLSQRREGDVLVLEDTRPCAVQPRYELRGLEAHVYDVCDEGKPPGAVVTACREAGLTAVTRADVEPILARFIEHKTMVFVSQKYLSLAVRAPWASFPPMEHFPGGRVLLRRTKAPKKPEELTVVDMFALTT
jgi:ribosomal peptide maturation radical SAM protein 1